MDFDRLTTRRLVAALMLFGVPQLWAADSATDLFVDRQLGGAKGVCCVLRCGDGALAAAIARRSELAVFAIDERPEQVAIAQMNARKTGLLGKTLFVDVGSASRIPLTNDYVDVLVIADLDDAALTALSKDEIRRVLSPRLGQTLIGRASLVKGKGQLSREALAAWCKDFEGASIYEDADGIWAVIRKPAKEGADNWSYWNHRADNNQASTDTAYGAPEGIRWIGRPYQTGWSVLYLAAGSRVFLAYTGDRFSGNVGWPRYGSDDALEVKEHQLHAFEGYNGRLLWSYRLPRNPWYGFHAYQQSIWIATDERFYLGELTDIVTLDAANGKELSRIKVADNGQLILWLAITDGIAFAMVGAKKADCFAGTKIVAHNLATQARVWEHNEPTAIDSHAIALAGSRIFLFAGESRAAALDLATGKELWSNEKLDDPAAKAVEWNPVTSHLICSKESVTVVNIRRGAITLSAQDGHELWRQPRGLSRPLGNVTLVEQGERLITNTLPKGKAYNLDTGAMLPPESYGFSGCGRLISTPKYTIGQLGTVYDLEKKQIVTRQYMKPICSVGNIVANGMRYSAPHWCRCLQPFRGVLAWARKDGQPAPTPAFPLEAGDTGAPPIVETNTLDWAQYRRDASHSGASPVGVGAEPPVEKWRAPAGVQTFPTAPIVVNDLVFLSGADGLVRCIDGTSGQARWDFQTAGKTYFPPTFADSRIFVGGADGRVYCLAAATGKLQWRFRAAPTERRLFVYDQLISCWPVNTNLVVDKGVVFATAGLVDTEGVYVHALDANTGKLKWTNDELGGLSGKGMGVVPVGAMTIAAGKLWVRTDLRHPSFDLESGVLTKTGAQTQAAADEGPDEENKIAERPVTAAASGLTPNPPSRERTGMGKDLGLFAGKFLIDGGRRMYSEQCDRVQRCDAFAQELEANGAALYPRYMLANRGLNMPLMPVWDQDVIVYFQNHKLTAVPAADYIKFLSSIRDQDKGVWAVPKAPPAAKWSIPFQHLNALALSKDAVLVAKGIPEETAPKTSVQKTRFPEWRLISLRRDDGRELWSVKLPAEPIFDGLAIDRNGRIVVSCADGSVVCYGR